MEKNNWHGIVALYERPYRLHAFLQIRDNLTDKEFWEIVGWIWIDNENIYQNFNEWHRLWSSNRTNRHLCMSEEEQQVIKSFSETITIWRGVRGKKYTRGLSWTIDRDKAIWFAKRFSSKNAVLLIEGTVKRTHVLAHFIGRNEQEIVALPKNVEKISTIVL
jgi:glycerol kinase